MDGELRNVVVTGDFFLYPEEALPILAGALENSPATLDEAGYAARVRTALDPAPSWSGHLRKRWRRPSSARYASLPAPEQDDRG